MDVTGLSIKELKLLISKAGLSAVGVTEKHELVALAKEAASLGATLAEPAPGPIPCGRSKQKFGGWDCEVIAPSGAVKDAIIMMHGFGATNDDFIPFAQHYAGHLPNVLWVFPQAEVDPSLGATAWWKINVMEWMMSMNSDEGISKLIRKEPEGLTQCRDRGVAMVQEVCKAANIPLERVHLSGFSQGGITSVDVALSLPSPPGSVAMISGAVIVVDRWAEMIAKHHGKHKIFVSHGEQDPVV